MRRPLVIAALLALPLGSTAQAPSSAIPEVPTAGRVAALQLPVTAIVFDFQRPELEPSRWGFELTPDGHGRYYAKGEPTPASPSGNVWLDVTASPATLQMILAGSKHGEGCETKAKHIANFGQKTLSYLHDDLWFTCTFNYSDDEAVTKASTSFQAMAATIQFGARLQRGLRFDRLSLDAEMTSLEDEVKAGRAIELQNIAPTLRALAGDSRVIDRVRRKAARMLDSVATASDGHEQPVEGQPR